jgi:MotA/TolQ/ExbB proton channel family protein
VFQFRHGHAPAALVLPSAPPVPYCESIRAHILFPMAQEIDPFKLSSPRIFLVRMVVFLTLCVLLVIILYKQIWTAFLANPGLNALIIAMIVIGVALAFRQVIRLFPEIDWVNGFRLADPGLAVERPPVLLAPMAVLLRERIGRMAISAQVMRGILDSIAARLDEARDMLRYMTGLLVFLGLLGTFWGLIETMSSVGNLINTLKPSGDAAAVFDSLKEGLAAPLGGMGISFSSSLFGLAGSLVLGFLDLQTSQAQNRFYTELEDWLSTTVRDLGVEHDAAAPMIGAPSGDLRGAIERLREAITDGGSNRAATSAMANLAEAIQGLVHHMRTEQQMIRDWVDSQAQQHREVRRLLEILVREDVKK